MTIESQSRLRELVAEVAAAYFSNSHVSPSEIPNVIDKIAKSLDLVGEERTIATEAADEASQSQSVPAAPAAPVQLTSAQIRKSITPDALISFEDNRPYKTLRRHLNSKGLSPEEYRRKWGLPSDYPMVAASYSESRSQFAKTIGLGQRSERQVAQDAAPKAAASKTAAKPRAATTKAPRKPKAAKA